MPEMAKKKGRSFFFRKSGKGVHISFWHLLGSQDWLSRLVSKGWFPCFRGEGRKNCISFQKQIRQVNFEVWSRNGRALNWTKNSQLWVSALKSNKTREIKDCTKLNHCCKILFDKDDFWLKSCHKVWQSPNKLLEIYQTLYELLQKALQKIEPPLKGYCAISLWNTLFPNFLRRSLRQEDNGHIGVPSQSLNCLMGSFFLGPPFPSKCWWFIPAASIP